MKKKSVRAARMERRRRRTSSPTINLVSLMDIFTILVFFLLVNSSDTQQVPSSKVAVLPESVAERLPKETLTILITQNDVVINGRGITTVDEIKQSKDVIEPLAAELQYLASRSLAPVDANGIAEREITIMGDKAIPYEVLKKIMVTCSQNEYTRISLAVVRKTEDSNT